jgi:tetraacyldisaccharide 4'-kinase
MGYRALTVLASPLLLLYLALRVARDRRYARGLAERLGRLPRSFRQTAPGAIWLHAVSVGEVLTAVPLLKRLKEALPWAPVYLSVTTLAGRAMAGEKLAGLVAGVFYAPLDLTFALRAVLRALRPVLVVVMETEIWPNLYREAQRSGAQLVLLNARISDRAMPAYRRWRWLFQAPLSRPDRILAQDERAAARYRELGAARVEVAGNLKYDFDPEAAQIAPDLAAWLERLHASPVWIAASTMPPERAGDPDEDDLVVETILRLRDALPRLLLIWAPRKPERFDAAAERLQRAGVAFVRRSRWQGEAALALPGVLLVDTIGELAALYRVGDAVFMGGTFPHRGGHNPLEPAAFGVPVVAGPHMENFAEIAADFDAQDAWIRVSSADRLAAVLAELLGDAARRAALGQRALALAGARRGASVRAVEALRASYEDALSRPLPVLWKRLLLVPLTLVWRAGLSLDRAIESTRARTPVCPVVSVGNLSLGGTGKTPFAIWLCGQLKQLGWRPGVLLRGYRRSGGPATLTAAPGATVTVEAAGEEALIHLRAGQAAVGVGADRARALAELQAGQGFDCAVLDDGFQHWRLRRDCDIVLIDALDPFCGGVLPLGRLREPFSALKRADAVVLTRTIAGRSYAGLVREIRRWNAAVPVFFARTMTAELAALPAGAGAFCALGNPGSFRATLAQAGVQSAFFAVFPDHHRYRRREVQALLARAPALVTTEKDWLNLPAGFQTDARIHVLRIRIEVDNADELLNLVTARLRAVATRA